MKMVIILTIVFGLMAIGMLALKRKRRIKYSDYKCRTIGWITGREPSDDDNSLNCVEYTYIVNGREYHGYGEVYTMHFSNDIKICYDPANPSEDCTWYEYWWDTGRAEAITFLILWGIAVITIALLGL